MKMLGYNISTLKNRLSEILNQVRKGKEVLVLDRNQPIARISRVSTLYQATKGEKHLQELENRGIIQRSAKKLPRDWLKKHPPVKALGSAVQALLDEREESF